VADETDRWMEGIDGRHEPLLEGIRGTIRIDLDEDGKRRRWFVSIDDGAVVVARRGGAPDCMIRASAKTFGALVRGERNAVAAVLRGAVTVEGDLELLVRFQRLFPGPPSTSAAKPARGGRS
jgi:putative sterol carrier protein